MGLEWVTIITIRMKIIKKINIFTLNGNMQGLLGVAPLSVTQIFSAACSSTPENKKTIIEKLRCF